jgi:type I restriction enzyme, S subunit
LTEWAERRLSGLVRERDDRGHPDAQVLSVYRDLGVVPKADRSDNYNKTPEDLTSYKKVRVGDLVINKMKAWSGSLAVSQHEGIVSGDYMVCEVLGPVDRGFLHHLLRSRAVFSQIAAVSTGIRPSQWRLYWDDLRDVRIRIPPKMAQRAIARYLDAETTRIAQLEEAYRGLARLHAERGSSTLSGCFTGRPTKLKRLVTKIGSGKTPDGGSESYVDDGVAFVRSMNVHDGWLDLSDMAHITAETDAQMASTRLKDGDVLLNITGASIGRSAVVPVGFGPGNVNQHVCIVRPRSGVPSTLLGAALLTAGVQTQIRAAQVGGNRDGLTFEQVGDLQVPWPKHADLADLEGRTWAIVGQARQFEKLVGEQIRLLHERRQALITAAVTGQIDIPGVAA